MFLFLFCAPNDKEVGANNEKQQKKRSILGVNFSVLFVFTRIVRGIFFFCWESGRRPAVNVQRVSIHRLHRNCDDKRRSKYALRTSSEPLFDFHSLCLRFCASSSKFQFCAFKMSGSICHLVHRVYWFEIVVADQHSAQLNAVTVAYGGASGEPVGASRKTSVEQRPVSCKECTHFHSRSRQM